MSTVSTVGLLQHYLKRHFQCDIFPLRYDLKNLKTVSDAPLRSARSQCGPQAVAANGDARKGMAKILPMTTAHPSVWRYSCMVELAGWSGLTKLNLKYRVTVSK